MFEYNQLPKAWQDVHDVLNAGVDRVIVYGPPGGGKTMAGLTMGNLGGSVHRLVCNEEMTSADVTGHYIPSADGSWSWRNGAVINAWMSGGRLVADEIDRASGDVLSLLLAMFDTPDSASWTNPATGEVIRPKEGFSVVMTTNIEDMADLPTALADRFPIRIRINEPHPAALMTLDEDVRVAASQSVDESPDRRISMRGWKEFCRLRKLLSDERAAELVFGSLARSVLNTIRVDSVTA
jgi:MoxR-like ATPase